MYDDEVTSVADEPKPNVDATNISPAPSDITETKPGDPAVAPAAPSATLPAEPLSDGTVPSIIKAGDGHKSVPKSKASLTRIYRRADILTTFLTFAGVLVALSVIAGAYFFFTSRGKTPAAAPKVTTLEKSELEKLGSFFQGNTAGSNDEVLTVASSTLFKNRLAVSSDLKVVGALDVTGPSTLSDVNVEKTATLGVTNVRGQLTVAGPTSLRGAAILGAGASIAGNLSVTGTGSFGGALSASSLNVSDVSISGTLNLAGRISIAGQNPSIAPGSEAGSGATMSIDGNDAAGNVTINTGTVPVQLPQVGGLLARITFRIPYPRTPKILISPIGQNGASLQYYVLKTATGFTIGSNNLPNSATSYSFDYWVVQ